MSRRKKESSSFKIPHAPSSGGFIEKYGWPLLLSIGASAAFSLPVAFFTESKRAVPQEIQLLIATVFYVILWAGGHALSKALLDSKDKQLFGYMPLTPRNFFLGNLRRHWKTLLIVLICAPIMGTLFLLQIPDGKAAITLNHILVLCTIQTIMLWLALLIPLFEDLTGERWTRFYFFPRLILYPLVRHPAITGGILSFIVTLPFILQRSNDGRTFAAYLLSLYHSVAPAGEAVLVLASPLFGNLQLFKYAIPHTALLWCVVAWLGSLAGFLTWRIWKATGKSIENLDEEIYSEWITHRSHYEHAQHYNAWFKQLYDESRLPQNILEDEEEYVNATRPENKNESEDLVHAEEEPAIAGGSDSPVEIPDTASYEPRQFDPLTRIAENYILPYDETLSPEKQAVRHFNFWLRPKTWKFTRTLTILITTIAICWAIGTISRTSYFYAHKLDIAWQVMAAFLLWAFSILTNLDYSQKLTWLNIHFSVYPMRFRNARRELITRTDIINWILLDIGMATAAILAMGLPWSSWIIVWGLLFLIRFEIVCCPFTYASLQPKVTSSQAILTETPGILVMFLPALLGFASHYFYPVLTGPARVIPLIMGLKARDSLVPGMFDIHVGGAVLLTVGTIYLLIWGLFIRQRNRLGDQSVTMPHYIPERIQPINSTPVISQVQSAPKDKTVSIWKLLLFAIVCLLLAGFMAYLKEKNNAEIERQKKAAANPVTASLN